MPMSVMIALMTVEIRGAKEKCPWPLKLMEKCQQQLEPLVENENVNAFTALTANQIKIANKKLSSFFLLLHISLCHNVYIGRFSIKLAIVGQVWRPGQRMSSRYYIYVLLISGISIFAGRGFNRLAAHN